MTAIRGEEWSQRPKERRLAVAAAFGSVSAAIFGPDDTTAIRRAAPLVPIEGSDNTLELVQRLRRSELDRATLDTLTITVEQLCSEYAYMRSADLRRESQTWMTKLIQLLDGEV